MSLDWIRRELCDAEQDADQRLTCLRKAVCTSLIFPDFSASIRYFNGPIEGTVDRCTNEVGGCGCIHSEQRAMIALQGSEMLADQSVIVGITYSPCTPCANLLTLLSDRIDSVYWLYDAEHDLRGIEILEVAGIMNARL